MGLDRNITHETVAELPLRPIITVLPDSTVRQAMAKMRAAHLGCVVVVNEYERPQGQFTERCLIRLLVERPEAIDEAVSKYMVEIRGCVTVDDPIAKVIDYMVETGLRFVCVTDPEGRKMVGLTGQKGVMEYVAEHFPRQVMVQRMRAKLHMDDREGA
jgi:CBS domain-containing protein